MVTIQSFIKQNIPGYSNIDVVIPFEIEQKLINSNKIITAFGQTESNLYFLQEGAVQVAIMKGDEERILEFVFPGEFFGAYTSLLLQQPSDVQVTALTKCMISVIRSNDLLKANQTSLLSSHLNLCIAQRLFLSRARREKEFLTMSAEERYLLILKRSPEVMKLIPGNKIARYLGIRAESLSRIRKSIIP